LDHPVYSVSLWIIDASEAGYIQLIIFFTTAVVTNNLYVQHF